MTMNINKAKIIICLFSLMSQPLWAAFEMSSWLSYQIRHEETLDLYGEKFTSIGMFAYDFDTNDNLRPADTWVDTELDHLMSLPHDGRPVYITIVNDIETAPPQQHNGDLVLRILSDPVKRAAHIQQLVQLSARADGIDIDYESLLAGTRPYYSQFIKELRAALPRGKLLSAVCQPKTSNAEGPRGQAIDWVAIQPYVDIMKIMTYYYSFGASPPGSSAPLDKVDAVTSLAVNEIPMEKLHIVLTQFGWDWPEGSNGSFVEYNEAMQIAHDHGVVPFRDAASQCLRVNYTDNNGVAHQIWFPDKTTLLSQIDIVSGHHVDKLDIWQMGVGDTAFWEWARDNTINPNQGNPRPNLTSINPSSKSVGSPRFTLTALGSGFIPSSIVLWNGSDRATTFVNGTKLTAAIPASDVSQSGVATVTVFNPTPGGGVSQGLLFQVGSPGGNGNPPPSGSSPLSLSSLDDVRVFPNPWIATRHGNTNITFDQLTQDATVKIFTVSSQWVKSVQANQGTAVWDLTNDNGEKVASGYYLFFVSDGEGRSNNGKLAIVK